MESGSLGLGRMVMFPATQRELGWPAPPQQELLMGKRNPLEVCR